jgi:L-aminopeptidase/D-esterase-like protein
MPTVHDAITDVPGIRVGHWTYRRGATGCTVVLCTNGAVGGVDVRGAAPGTRETDLLRPGNRVEEVHAVVLSGGSAFGLATADGVMRYLAENNIGLRTRSAIVPIVPAAILFDLGIGTTRSPDAMAGERAARRATAGKVAEGSVGAGTGATIAKLAGPSRALKGGIGTASEHLATGTIVGALVAVNARGAIRDPDTGVFIAAPRADRSGFIDLDAHLRSGREWSETDATHNEVVDHGVENTTLVVVSTNAALSREQANRLATVSHNGLASTIWPAHTPVDGDVVFTLATGAVEIDLPEYAALEAMATRAVARAVLKAVRAADGLAGIPSIKEWGSTHHK